MTLEDRLLQQRISYYKRRGIPIPDGGRLRAPKWDGVGPDPQKSRGAQKRYSQKQRARKRTRYSQMSPEQKAAHSARVLRYKNKNRERIKANEALAARKRRAKDPEKHRRSVWKANGMPEPTWPRPSHCECCGNLPRGKHKTLVLDHDHESGKFRGWLCDLCNRGMGMLGDSINGIRNAIDYLERARLVS